MKVDGAWCPAEPSEREGDLSVGDNFHHQPNSPITFSARYTPVDDQGDMLHDERVEAEGSATIN